MRLIGGLTTFLLKRSFCAEIRSMKRIAVHLLFQSVVQLSFGVMVLSQSSQDGPKDERQFVKPEAIQGCYELALSSWRPNLDLGEDTVFITPPHRIQLFAEKERQASELGLEWYVVKAAPGVKPSIHSHSYWIPKSSQSIKIVWTTTGLSGLAMYLKIDGSDLRGTAKTFWHFTRERQTADVVARKADCEKP